MASVKEMRTRIASVKSTQKITKAMQMVAAAKLRRAQSADDPVTLTSERFKDNWGYRLDVPNPVEKTRFVRGIVQALLLEEANRKTSERPAPAIPAKAIKLSRQARKITMRSSRTGSVPFLGVKMGKVTKHPACWGKGELNFPYGILETPYFRRIAGIGHRLDHQSHCGIN